MFYKTQKLLIIVIVLFAVGLGLGCTTNSIEESQSTDTYDAVFFALPQSNTIVTPAELSQANVHTTLSYTELQTILASSDQTISILYLHPDTVPIVEKQWLQEVYLRGITIVALNTPVSQLSNQLDFTPPMADLDVPEPQEEQLLISLYQNLDEAEQRQTGGRVISEYFADFQTVAAMIDALAKPSVSTEQTIISSP